MASGKEEGGEISLYMWIWLGTQEIWDSSEIVFTAFGIVCSKRSKRERM